MNEPDPEMLRSLVEGVRDELGREMREQLESMGASHPEDGGKRPGRYSARAVRFNSREEITCELWRVGKDRRRRQVRRQVAKVLIHNAFNGLWPTYLFAYQDIQAGGFSDVWYTLRRYRLYKGQYRLSSSFNIRPTILAKVVAQLQEWEGQDLVGAFDDALDDDLDESVG